MTQERRQTAANVGARRAKGVSMLIAGERHAVIAKACKVSSRQVERWAALPEVRTKVDVAATAAEATATSVLVNASRLAAQVLVDVLNDADATPADRTRAALAVLDRTGHAASTKTEVTGKDGGPQEVAVSVTIDTAKRIARGMKEPQQ